jgi:homogentisate 1,2-dioxygenase
MFTQNTTYTAAAHSNNRAGQTQNHTIASHQQYYQQMGPPWQSNPHPKRAASQTQQMQPARIQQQQATPLGQPTANSMQAMLSNNHQNPMSKMSLTPTAHPSLLSNLFS